MRNDVFSFLGELVSKLVRVLFFLASTDGPPVAAFLLSSLTDERELLFVSTLFDSESLTSLSEECAYGTKLLGVDLITAVDEDAATVTDDLTGTGLLTTGSQDGCLQLIHLYILKKMNETMLYILKYLLTI